MGKRSWGLVGISASGLDGVRGGPTREIRRRAALVRRRRGPELVLVVEEEVAHDGAAGREEGGREEPTRTRRGRGGEGAPASSGVPGGEVEVQRRGGEEAEAGRGGGVDGAASGGVGLLWIPIQIGREKGGVVGRVGCGCGEWVRVCGVRG